jgi:NitT/TauT family transport system permease protein
MANTAPAFPAAQAQARTTLGWVDLLIFAGLFGLGWSVLHFGKGMTVHFDVAKMPQVSMDLRYIPYYAGRTLLRMWIAFGFSLLFTLVMGYLAAKNRVARGLILPAMDIMQSVPVLGFLSATVTGFMALFPGSLLGVECASIFAIFTGQVWNMAFGFYHSMVTVPTDLQEVATTYGLNRWQRFTTVEVPSSMHSLIWNSMMSFGGGWFFVSASEAISVMNMNIQLPGLGSYMANAVQKGDNHAAFWAIVAMLILILASDQLIWRPLLAWADKFKIEMTVSSDPPRSWVFDLLRRARLFAWLQLNFWQPFSEWLRQITVSAEPEAAKPARRKRDWTADLGRVVGVILLIWIAYEMTEGVIAGIGAVRDHVTLAEFGHMAWLGFLTMLRVVAVTILATIIWTPVGVWMGFHPKLAGFVQPLAQIAASFPVNMTFPFIVGFYVAHHISMNWGSIFLIAMGTQWYILFNVIAGAMAIPNDLKEVARTYGLRGWPLWRNLILPSIFPFWVTGACTAAGGAWNASIVAELATWGNTTLRASGLGAFISEVTAKGDTPLIICSIVIMSMFVVTTNKLVWRRLYDLAERRYHLD